MRVVIARMMPEPSMDVYADGIISGLRSVRPNWEIVDLKPQPVDRKSRSLLLRVWKYYERFWRFPQQVQQQVADIFHIIDPSEAHITYWLKKKNKAVVVTCHDLVNFYSHDNLQGSVELPFLSRGMWIHAVKGMKYADHVVAVSSATAKDTTQIMDIEPARISVIPNAVEAAFQPLPKEQAESLRQKYGISPETVCLLNVGSNHPRKNLSTILKVIETLQQRGLSIHLWKVGADFTDEQKIFIKTQGLENHISYLGKPDKSTLIQIYNAADMLIAPSLHEGFGITLLEAMACGIPVITSKVSAMPEVVGDAGVLVDPNDYQAIADAVCHLHNHPDSYQELVNKGLARAKLFTWEKAGEQIAEIYEKVQACKEFKGVAKT
ncbi:glycosyltransferase family 4 protein [Brasilonema octagenarum]|uniref:Glycosyltransferase family 1 protein n=1 Tax=Brasilonema octagenarum UFV-OR1 TaxID=417115 RepID=A0ABX1M884_9CYAN|nr:glycosyltransferase family 1 protein [Brasilonema octagenarum]NMF62217.1 glycosyltransferase family 1 protein [Brasilonema octagenarum UFV-OR1]